MSLRINTTTMQQQNTAIATAARPVDQNAGQAIMQPHLMIITPATQFGIAQPQSRKPVKYATKQSVVLGSIQIGCGILCIIFTIVIYGISPYFTVAHAGTGIWTAVFFILTGTFGVIASKQKTKCTIVTFMVLSIFATVLAFVLLIVSAIAWGTVNHDCTSCQSDAIWDCQREYQDKYPRDCIVDCEMIGNCTECWNPGYCDCLNSVEYEECIKQCKADSGYEDDYYYKCESNTYDEECGDHCGVIPVLSAMNGLILCASLVEIIVSIWSSAICCWAICCCVGSSNTQRAHVIPVDAQTMQMLQQQTIYLHPGAPGVVMYHPQAVNAQQHVYQGTNSMPPPYQPADPNNQSEANQAMAPPNGNNQEQLQTKE